MLWKVQKKGKFEVLRLASGVRVSTMIVGIAGDEKICLIRKYCAGSGEDEIVLPGGQVELGEKVDIAAAREFFEETGKKITELKVLGELQILPAYIEAKTVGYWGIVDETFLQGSIDSEVRNVLLLQKGEVLSWIKNGKIKDARSVAFLLFYLQS